MIKRTYSKILGTIIGTLTIIVTLGVGFLFLIGMGLNQAFSTEVDSTPNEQPILYLLIIISLVISGLITAISPFAIKRKATKVIFIGYCFILGIVGLVVFFISAGALGNGFEYTLLAIGFAFFLLGYLIIKEH